MLAAGFPINDGGMFASLVDSIGSHGQLLPDLVTYNNLNAPFAYPPLAFLLTAGLEQLIPIGTVEWLRWIPLVASIATIPAFALLALEITPSRVHAVVATFVYALMPSSFAWLVMGGGLARAPGMLFAILAVYLLARFLHRRDRSWIAAGVALGLAVVTHPQAGLFTALSLSLVALARARGRWAWARVGGAAMIGVAVAAPWILMVVGRYGLAPLTSAGGTGLNPVESVFRLVTFRVTDEPLLGLVGGLAVLGAVYSLAVRRFLLPVWVAAVVLLDPRGSVTFASVPLAMLAASGLLDVVAARVSGVGGDITRTTGWPAAFLRSTAVRAVLVGSLVLAMLSALLAPYLLGSMATLSPDTRAAMTWVRDAVPAGSRVVVVTGRDWYEDATAEWFPYLAQRSSVATVQGYEWLGADAWTKQLDIASSLQAIADSPVASLDSWAASHDVEFDVLFVPKGKLGDATSPSDCCSVLRDSLRSSGEYVVIYDGPGATIARRQGA